MSRQNGVTLIAKYDLFFLFFCFFFVFLFICFHFRHFCFILLDILPLQVKQRTISWSVWAERLPGLSSSTPSTAVQLGAPTTGLLRNMKVSCSAYATVYGLLTMRKTCD